MAHKAATLVTDYISRLTSLEVTRTKIERVTAQGKLTRRDVEKMYEILYLRAFTELEVLIEELFIGLLTRSVLPQSREVVPRVSFNSGTVARKIVYGGRNYVDWFPYERTIKLANAFFRGGKPFTNISNNDTEKLLIIRNAIAHDSTHALRLFLRDVIGATPLLSREKKPAGYLRSQLLGSAPTQTRLQHHTIEMVDLARRICS